jgi:hypothetical protein
MRSLRVCCAEASDTGGRASLEITWIASASTSMHTCDPKMYVVAFHRLPDNQRKRSHHRLNANRQGELLCTH